ncbi:Phenol 2-monooxygenase [Lasiodiplodia theobromae]|uniref:Phenol 2-monooxygenase n=1 Tax=Lasiodiplodia theobromae TaxID=45133 RepID=UPI0015C30FA4|nr:Phenol 2-monooxygenase [Lasiodiplodia theobromae]KAF4546334.1 Phenol 2-monooxygenase [Lasiodiplodia theobromae]
MLHEYDVVICGAGSAGLCAAAWLSRCGISFRLLEKRSGPLKVGQADGVQCRTVEIFESFGLSEDLMREAYHVLEVSFWESVSDGIARKRRTVDTPKGLSHMPHVILNQARVNELMVEDVRRFGGPEIEYGYEVQSVHVDDQLASDPNAHCVSVFAVKDGVRQEFKAKYVLGCDGAHSVTRKSLHINMVGNSTDAVWGVMDVYPRTNFPDIRKKVMIHSHLGNIIIIPREGGSLTRFYVELAAGTQASEVQLEDLQRATSSILQPYQIDFVDTAWWSAYAIGQRLADNFTYKNRVFLTGDACHTHSPKAGQGMNVSLQDGHNIGWKLAAVLNGNAKPTLLETYVSERQKVAAELIAFDESWTKLFKTGNDAVTAQEVSERFIQAARYTAGLTSRNLKTGMRFPTTQVVRFCDAKPMQLARLADTLGGSDGIVSNLTPKGADLDSVIETIVVLSGKRHDLEQDDIPEYFRPTTGKMQIQGKPTASLSYTKNVHGHAYKFYGVDTSHGTIVIVRPDQYVAAIYALWDFQSLRKFFNGFMLPNKLTFVPQIGQERSNRHALL